MPVNVIEKSSLTEAKWLERRRTGIGGSDAPVIMGMSKWGSPIEIWDQKVNGVEIPITKNKNQILWGHRLEPVIMEHFCEFANKKVAQAGQFAQHNDYPWLLGTNDGRLEDDSILEIKTCHQYAADDWGESGSDKVPQYYSVQCHHYMAVFDAPRAYVAVLIGGSDFRWFRIERDKALEEDLITAEKGWWDQYVIGKVPPPLDGSDSANNFLKRTYPDDNGKLIVAEGEIADHVSGLRACYSNAKQQKADLEELKNIFKDAIGNNHGLETEEGKITWGRTKDGKKTDYKALCAYLREALKITPEDYDQFIKQFSTVKPGTRVFKVPSAWSKQEK